LVNSVISNQRVTQKRLCSAAHEHVRAASWTCRLEPNRCTGAQQERKRESEKERERKRDRETEIEAETGIERGREREREKTLSVKRLKLPRGGSSLLGGLTL